MLLQEENNSKVYNLLGKPITQAQLAKQINQVYQTQLLYKAVSFETYAADRKAELGEFLGLIVAGIYQGIHDGKYSIASDYAKAAGRAHKSSLEMIQDFKKHHG